MSWIIRKASEYDAQPLFEYLMTLSGEIGAINREMLPFLAEAERDYIMHFNAQPHTDLRIAEDNGQIVGMMTIEGAAYSADAMLNVNIHPDYQGMGLGVDLIRTAINWARLQEGIWRVQMNIGHDLKNLPYYERIGFVCDAPGVVTYYMHQTTMEFRAVNVLVSVYTAS